MRQLPQPFVLSFCLVLPVVLSACVHARRCDVALPGQPVYLDVTYAADGTPEVTPASCTVRPGVKVTWQGPSHDDTSFKLRFHGNPGTVEKGRAPGGEARMRASSLLEIEAEPGTRREVRITAEHPGDYKYDVDANGHRLDPHIIIER